MNAGPLMFLAAMVAVLWFILIRPQRQRAAAHRSMISGLSPEDHCLPNLPRVGGAFLLARRKEG